MRIWLCLLLFSIWQGFAAQLKSGSLLEELSKQEKSDALRTALENHNIRAVLDLSLVDAPCTDPELFGFACQAGSLEIVTLLLDLGALPNRSSSNRCSRYYGFYPVHRAALSGNIDIIAVLCRRGASLNQKTHRGNFTSLTLAASHGHAELTKMLYARVLGGLHRDIAVRKELSHHIASSGNVSLMQWYLSTEYATIDQPDEQGNLPIFKAAFWGKLAMVTFLLAQRPRHLRMRNNAGWDLMAVAAKNNRAEIVEYLRSKGLTLTKKDSIDRQTAVHRAAADCYGNLVRQGIETDSFNPRMQDKQGWNAMHYATRNGCLQVIKMLHEEFGVSLGQTTGSPVKWRPAHIAAARGHLHVLRYFTEQGVNLFVKDGQGRTPLYCASHYRQGAAIAYLKEVQKHQPRASLGGIKKLLHRGKR